MKDKILLKSNEKMAKMKEKISENPQNGRKMENCKKVP